MTDSRRDSPMARWSAVMDAFAERDSWGVRELAAHTGMPRSAVHRILHEMARLELLAEAETPGRLSAVACRHHSGRAVEDSAEVVAAT